MRGDDQQQNHMFSYLSPEMRVRKDHPLRAIRAMVDEVLTQLSRRFDGMYATVGRPSIAPEKLLRAQLLQMQYSIRSERLLMEEMDYNLLFRWFVGLNASNKLIRVDIDSRAQKMGGSRVSDGVWPDALCAQLHPPVPDESFADLLP
jgi:transposase